MSKQPPACGAHPQNCEFSWTKGDRICFHAIAFFAKRPRSPRLGFARPTKHFQEKGLFPVDESDDQPEHDDNNYDRDVSKEDEIPFSDDEPFGFASTASSAQLPPFVPNPSLMQEMQEAEAAVDLATTGGADLSLLQDNLVGVQHNHDLSSACMEDAESIDLQPILRPLVGEVGTGIMACSEVQRKLQETLNMSMDACVNTKQLLLVVGTRAKTTDGKMALLGCKRHTRFSTKSQRSMSNLKNLLAIDHGVRTEDDYLRVFSSEFSTNETAQGKSMQIVAIRSQSEAAR